MLPTLARAYRLRRPGAARWLASFTNRIARKPKYAELFDNGTEIFFLTKAIEHDSTDRRSLERLVDHRAHSLAYTLHELPAGVLYGYNGATEAECGELLEELMRFEELVIRAGERARYEELIARCRRNYEGYAEYLRNRAQWATYAAYMAAHKIE